VGPNGDEGFFVVGRGQRERRLASSLRNRTDEKQARYARSNFKKNGSKNGSGASDNFKRLFKLFFVATARHDDATPIFRMKN